MLVASCMMVVLQCCTSTAVVGSTFMQSCTTNNQCPLDMQGQLCSATRRRCLYCGTPPLEIVEIAPDGTASLVTDLRKKDYEEYEDYDAAVQLHTQRQQIPGWKTLNQPTATNFAGFNITHVHEVCRNPALDSREFFIAETWQTEWSEQTITNWCDSCFHAETGTVNTLTEDQIGNLNISAMGIFDWAALVFATTIVALAIIGELVGHSRPSYLRPLEYIQRAVVAAATISFCLGWLH